MTLADPTPAPTAAPSGPIDASSAADAPCTPRWYRPTLWALLAVVAVAYLWGLGASRWANSFYSAAAQAGSVSWKALFFGSSDAANAITVDKPPASLWAMGLSARIFGVNAWSILVPQALMGVGSVALVVAAVKRWFRPGAALLAGAVFAVTPVAALMFRFNNPDALLVLLLCASAYAVTRAIEAEGGSWRWLALAGVLVGTAFLSKMLQAFVVGPAFAGAYLVAARTDTWRRIRDLAVLAVSTFAGAAWWIAVVELWPASSRPYIGGSQHNSVVELVFGYNGLGRLTGNEVGSVRSQAAVATTGRWGPTGWLRMFNVGFGGQISWLLPAALLLLVAGSAWTLRAPRTDRARAALILWGGWLVVTGLMFSLGQGIIHQYYTVALAPAIGAVVGIGASMAWDRRDALAGRAVMAASVLVTTAWTVALLQRTRGWYTWLPPVVVVGGVLASTLLLVGERVRRGPVTASSAGVVVAVLVGLAAPAAATVSTVRTPHTGAIPTAAPPMREARSAHRAHRRPAAPGTRRPPVGSRSDGVGTGRPARHNPAMTGLLQSRMPTRSTVAALRRGAAGFDWVLATVGSNNAAGYQLASGEPVMAIGGFNGTDPFPTLRQFRRLVAEHRVHYFVTGLEGGYRMGGSDEGERITDWVRSRFEMVDVGDVPMYDLTVPSGG